MKSFKELSKNQRRLVTAGIVALSLIIVLIATPFIIQHQISKLLLEMGAQEASVTDVNLNPFSGVVEITGLHFSTVTAKNQKLGQLSINLHILSLFKKWIHIKSITMDGLNLLVEIDESGKPIVGGLNIPASPESDKKSKQGKPWGFGIDAMALSQINVDYRDPKLETNLNIQELTIGDLANWNGEQASPISLKAKVNKNAIEFVGRALPFAKDPTFAGKVMLKQVELKPFSPLVPQLTTLTGKVSLDSTIELVQRADKSIEATHAGEFKLDQLKVTNPDISIEQEQLTWKGSVGITIKEEAFHSSMDAVLKLKGIKAASGESELASLGALSTTIKFDALENITLSENSIEQLVIGNKLYKAESEKVPARSLLSIGNISVANLSLAEMSQLEIDEVAIKDISSLVRRDPQGVWVPVTLVESLPQQESSVEAEENNDDADSAIVASEEVDGESGDASNTTTFKVGKLTITGENHILFDDQNVTPPYRAELSIKSLEVGTIDSTQPDQASSLKLLAAVDKHSEILVEGTITPLAAKPTLELTQSIKAVPLSPLSSYVVPIMGYTLTSGQLDTDGNLKMGNGKIEGEIKLVLNALEVESVPDDVPANDTPATETAAVEPTTSEADDSTKDGEAKKGDKLDSKMSIPLGVALNMLRDSNRTIKLTIPISGSSDNPNVDPSDVINTVLAKALKKGAMSYLISSMQPYGALISLVKMAGESAMKVRLEPVKFESTSATINDTTREYLPKVVKLMADRPELNIKVCGVATETDHQSLLAEATAKANAQHAAAMAKHQALIKKLPKAKAAQTAVPILVIPAISDEQLLELAKSRVIAVKDLLITELKAKPTHLIDCQPTINRESEENPPRVELLI